MNIALKLGRSFAKRGLRPIAGFGIVGLVVAGFVHLPTSDNQQVVRVASPLGNRAIAQPAQLDVPYVPTPTAVVNAMLSLDEVTSAGYFHIISERRPGWK